MSADTYVSKGNVYCDACLEQSWGEDYKAAPIREGETFYLSEDGEQVACERHYQATK